MNIKVGEKMKKLIIGLLIILILTSYTSQDRLIVQGESVSGIEHVKDNLSDLSLEERKVLEDLFLIVQGIKEMEELEKLISLEINDIEENLLDMVDQIEKKQSEYNHNLNIMEEILKSHQRNGATTYLELILSSDSLGTLLKRINYIRDISRNTSDLLSELEISKERLLMDKEKLDDTLKELEKRQGELKRTIDNSILLKTSLENKLSSLQENKLKYEEYLNLLEKEWSKSKPIFTNTINQLVKIIETGDVPENMIRISFTSTGIKGTIKEDYINEVLKSKNLPTEANLLFSNDKIELALPELSLYMSGDLILLDDKTSLKFIMDEGEFHGMKLELAAMEELFSFGYLQFNFHKYLEGSTIRSIKINENSLELFINLKL